MYFYFQIIIILLFFYFNTASSGVCQSLRVHLQNNAKEAQWKREGTYLLETKVNGQPSWTSKSCSCGIWYLPDIRRWMIGPLKFIGSDQGGIESKDLGNKLEYPENIVDWNYHTEYGWVFYNGNDDIIIECIGYKDHKKKGKSILLFLTLFLTQVLMLF